MSPPVPAIKRVPRSQSASARCGFSSGVPVQGKLRCPHDAQAMARWLATTLNRERRAQPGHIASSAPCRTRIKACSQASSEQHARTCSETSFAPSGPSWIASEPSLACGGLAKRCGFAKRCGLRQEGGEGHRTLSTSAYRAKPQRMSEAAREALARPPCTVQHSHYTPFGAKLTPPALDRRSVLWTVELAPFGLPQPVWVHDDDWRLHLVGDTHGRAKRIDHGQLVARHVLLEAPRAERYRACDGAVGTFVLLPESERDRVRLRLVHFFEPVLDHLMPPAPDQRLSRRYGRSASPSRCCSAARPPRGSCRPAGKPRAR